MAEYRSEGLRSLRVSRARAFYPWAIGVFVLALWLGRLFTVEEYFERTYELGWYPPDGDSIAIPIAGNAMATLLAVPFVGLGLRLILRRFPSRVRLLAWSDEYLGTSLLWTTAWVLLCYSEITDIAKAVRLRLPVTLAAALLWLAVWSLLRAILVSKALDRIAADLRERAPR